MSRIALGRAISKRKGTERPEPRCGAQKWLAERNRKGLAMDSIIYLVGLIVIVMLILSALGLR
jgi:hypothetical protein